MKPKCLFGSISLLVILFLAGCSNNGMFVGINQTNVELSEANYKIVASNIVGKSRAGYLVGFSASFGATTQTFALARIDGTGMLYKEALEDLWLKFESIIEWIDATFTNYRKEMKGQDWGNLYYTFKDNTLDPEELEREISYLMADSDVTSKRGIYHYVLSRNEKYLNIRAFDNNIKRESYELAEGKCKKCGKHFDITEMEAHHKKPWKDGGKTELSNCVMLCKECHDGI